ncbi:MAG: hypothetical protein RMN51_10690 [Verrucomicrobiota bacterium]|nr:hypothetical protein [Limisphaera sp.]MDW8382554.1 hypothetical protein [Verrucomicrobiota bacterium]
MTDDGIELDFSERNTRCFANRIGNVRVGISLQPVLGGPCYVWRNEILHTEYTPFKLHNAPQGGLIVHNTSIRRGVPLVVWSGEPVRDSWFRNNLFVGTEAQAADWTSPAVNCDLDYNGYCPGTGVFNLGNARYASLGAAARAGWEGNGRAVAWPVFESSVVLPEQPQQSMTIVPLELRADSQAVDVAQRLPNLNIPFVGAGPDLGARERGAPAPWYGPRPLADHNGVNE